MPLDAAYALAMAQFPDDNEIAVLYAESVMNLSRWNSRGNRSSAQARFRFVPDDWPFEGPQGDHVDCGVQENPELPAS